LKSPPKLGQPGRDFSLNLFYYWSTAAQPLNVLATFGTGRKSVFPATPSDFVLVGNEIFNVKSGDLQASIPRIEGFVALSPSAKCTATTAGRSSHYRISVFDTFARKERLLIDGQAGDADICWLGFLDDHRLGIVWRDGPDRSNPTVIQVWDVNTGKLVKSFNSGSSRSSVRRL